MVNAYTPKGSGVTYLCKPHYEAELELILKPFVLEKDLL
jgi:hypothetical protein